MVDARLNIGSENSALIAEGRNVIYVARQLGHGAQLRLGRYGHVIEELEGTDNVTAEATIQAARAKDAAHGCPWRRRSPYLRAGVGNKKPSIWRAFWEAAEETRTLDLLHGKDRTGLRAVAPSCANACKHSGLRVGPRR
jgi:hypothetical protein